MITAELAARLIACSLDARKNLTMDMAQLGDLYRCVVKYQSPTSVDDGDDGGYPIQASTESGILFSFVDNMAASICPLDPKIKMSARKKSLMATAKARELMINAEFERIKLARYVRQSAIRAAVFPRQITRAVWDTKRQRLVLRNVSPNRFVFDLDAEQWEDLKWVAEARILSQSEFQEKVSRKTKRTPLYGKDLMEVRGSVYPDWARDPADTEKNAQRDQQSWVVVWQFYDFTGDGRFMEFLEDRQTPILVESLPYKHVRNPFFLLSFNSDLNSLRGFSDAMVVQEPMHRMGELGTLNNEFVRATIPHPILDESSVDDVEQTVEAFRNVNGPRSVVRVKVANGKSIQDVLSWRQAPGVNPAFMAAMESNKQDIMFRLGMPEYSRGATGTGQVATEFALAQAADQTRRGYKMSILNELIQWIGACVIGFYKEFMGAEQAYPVGGVSEDQEWEDLNRSLLGFDGSPRDEDMLTYDVSSYSGLDGNPALILQKLMTVMQYLLQNPNVDQSKLIAWIIELMEAPPALLQKQQPMPPGAPGAPGAPPSGELPPDAAAMPGIAQPGGEVPGAPKIPMRGLAGMAGGAGHPAPVPPGLGKT